MPQQFTNNARALLVSGISDTATTLVIESDKADLFPVANVGTGFLPSSNNWFKLTLQNSSGAVEIVAVRTRNAGSAILSNVIRGYDGTTAISFSAGTVVGLRLTSADIESILYLPGANNAFSGDNTFSGNNTFSGGTALGTPVSGNMANVTNLPISTGVSGLGTGVAAALAVNIGTAGAPVVYGGALGTPASATLTNATGLPLATGVSGTLPIANGGTGLTSVGAAGNVLTSNGTAWVSNTIQGGAGGQVFYSSGTFTVPAGVVAVKVTVIGGGGNGGSATRSSFGGNPAGGGGGGAGGAAIKYVTGLTPGATISVTVGGVSGSSSFGAYCSATGGGAGSSSTDGSGAAGAAGTGVGDFVPTTTASAAGSGGPCGVGAGGGAGAPFFGQSIYGRSGAGGSNQAGSSGTGYGSAGGGGGTTASGTTNAGGAGRPGIVFVEW